MIAARARHALVALAATAALSPLPAYAADKPVIVLIGGRAQGAPQGEHDFAEGVIKIERLIKAASAFKAAGVVVKSYPIGFPKDLAELDDASAIVLYNGLAGDGAARGNPAVEPTVRAALDKLMTRGVGLVALHQAFTMPAGAKDTPFADWLGGVRIGSDRTTEVAPLRVAAKAHPTARGVGSFTYLDEFYPTISFGHTSRVTPVVEAHLHTQYQNGVAAFDSRAADKTVAWANERPGGGRAFGYAGTHYLLAFDDANVRKLILNAILWTAKLDVPAGGVAVPSIPTLAPSGQLPAQEQTYLLRAGDAKPEAQPWGELTWFASRALGNSNNVTVGRARIRPGQQNPRHWHPNCDEVLHLIQGRILNRMGDKEFEMKAGDTVVIPEGMTHNAKNIGTEDVILLISYNSADRVAIGEN